MTAIEKLTAMSGLSAKTYSWGGSTGRGRFFWAGELPVVVAGVQTPPCFVRSFFDSVRTISSSVDGGDESGEDSELDITISMWLMSVVNFEEVRVTMDLRGVQSTAVQECGPTNF